MRQKNRLTEKESEIMRQLWSRGPLFVRQMLEEYPDPKPHFNTVSTTVRILEDKGFVSHEVINGSHCYHATVGSEYFRRSSLESVVRNYFNNSYRDVVSALVTEEKISDEELREILQMIEKRHDNG